MGVVTKSLLLSLLITYISGLESISDFRHGAVIEDRGEVILVDSFVYIRVKTLRTVKVPSYLYKMIDLLGSLEDNVIKLTGDKEKTYEPEIYDKLGTEVSNSLERAKEKALKLFD